MQNNANKLTNQQLKFAQAAEYPRIKHEVIDFFTNQFQLLGSHLQANIHHPLISKTEYKITKGENLDLMPYTVLDFPRISGSNFPILMRTIFWWGHHISFNLLIEKSEVDMDTAGSTQLPPKTLILTSDDIWEQRITSANFKAINCINEAMLNRNASYIKLSYIIPIEAHEKVITEAEIYIKWLYALCPNR